MVTGRMPRQHGVWCNGIKLPEDQPTLPRHLADRGWNTLSVGKHHYEPFGGAACHTESRNAWRERGELADWHGPYYGFQDVAMAGGHGAACNLWGHYGAWLKEQLGEAEFARLARENDAREVEFPQRRTSPFPAELHHSNWVGETASAKIAEYAAKDAPFMLFASFPDPHHPFAPPEPYASMYDRADMVMPPRRDGEMADKPPHFADRLHGTGPRFEGASPESRFDAMTDDDVRDVIARTYGMVTLVDENVGRMLAALEEAGIADETLVVFTSDHGDYQGDHGLMFKGPIHYDGLLLVPYIWRVPGMTVGRRVAAPASQLDFADTVCDLTGVERMGTSQGMSMRPVLEGEAESYRESAVIEFRSQYRRHLDLTTIRTPQWKLTHYRGQPYGELYDLANDPDEFVNLYDDPGSRDRRDELEGLLLAEEAPTRPGHLEPECHA